MKTIIAKLLLLTVIITAASCNDDQFDLNYTAPVTINFKDVSAKNIVTVDKGVTSYSVNISVASTVDLSVFEVYEADPMTGAKGDDQIKSEELAEGTKKITFDYTFTNLVSNQCIKVIVSDTKGSAFERNLLVKITPAVIFSESKSIETAEAYYGIYYASWLSGRVYMRPEALKYKGEVDFALGDLEIEEGTGKVSAFVSPAKRGDYGLLNVAGLNDTQIELTTMTAAEFDEISMVDATPITNLAAPTLSAVEINKGSVYLFKTAGGRTGLIKVESVTDKTGTIEVSPGEWVEKTPYSLVKLSTKVVAK